MPKRLTFTPRKSPAKKARMTSAQNTDNLVIRTRTGATTHDTGRWQWTLTKISFLNESGKELVINNGDEVRLFEIWCPGQSNFRWQMEGADNVIGKGTVLSNPSNPSTTYLYVKKTAENPRKLIFNFDIAITGTIFVWTRTYTLP